MDFKPMLACSTVPAFDSICYPVLASPKLDGIRCLAVAGKAYSRNGKLIPNLHVQEYFRDNHLHGFDGELMISGDFNSVQSAIMSIAGKPNFKYYVFDLWNLSAKIGFKDRLAELAQISYRSNDTIMYHVPQTIIGESEALKAMLVRELDDGYEGLIIRDPNGPYKNGRSTAKQEWMSKIKLFNDAEATVVGTEELCHNLDTSTRQKSNMVPGGVLGALVVEWEGKRFNVGSGFDGAQRAKLWEDRDSLIGKQITFKYQECSKYGIPRFPTFKGFRYD